MLQIERHISPLMVVCGLNSSEERGILAIEPMGTESEDTYSDQFQSLKQRGLKHVWLVISDAPGFEKCHSVRICRCLLATV